MVSFHLPCPMIPYKFFLLSLWLNPTPHFSAFSSSGWSTKPCWESERALQMVLHDINFCWGKNSGLCQPQPQSLCQPGHLRSLKRNVCGIVVFSFLFRLCSKAQDWDINQFGFPPPLNTDHNITAQPLCVVGT